MTRAGVRIWLPASITLTPEAPNVDPVQWFFSGAIGDIYEAPGYRVALAVYASSDDYPKDPALSERDGPEQHASSADVFRWFSHPFLRLLSDCEIYYPRPSLVNAEALHLESRAFVNSPTLGQRQLHQVALLQFEDGRFVQVAMVGPDHLVPWETQIDLFKAIVEGITLETPAQRATPTPPSP